MYRKLFALVSLCLLLLAGSGAQILDLEFTSLGIERGLSNSKATCITQDTLGFIWIGTQDGLNRYDGYDLQIFKHDGGKPGSIPNNYIRSLYTDSHGTVWIGTDDGLCKYVRENNRFESIQLYPHAGELEVFKIGFIGADNGQFLLFSVGNMIYRLYYVNGKIESFIELEKGEVSAIQRDTKGNIWVSGYNGGGLVKYDYTGKKLKRNLPSNRYGPEEHASSIFSFTLRGEHQLWMATEDDGIYMLDLRYDSLKKYPVNSQDERFTRYVYVDNNQRLWSGDYTGIKLYLDDEDRFFGYYPVHFDPNSIRANSAMIFQDNQNNYWVLHNPGGVSFSVVPKGFRFFTDHSFETWRISTPNISAISEDTLGNLYMANPYNGLDIFHWIDYRIYQFHHEEGNPNSLGAGAIFDLRTDKTGMWIGSNRGGLQLFGYDLKKFTTYLHDPEDPSSIASNDVRSMAHSANGDLWIAAHGKGVDRFDRSEMKFKHYNAANSGLSNDWTFDVLEDSKRRLWVATAYGLGMLHPDSTRFHNYFSSDIDTNTLSYNEVVTIFEDAKNNIWIGTNRGLNRFIEEENQFMRITGALSEAYICSIMDDANHDLWIGTLTGLFRYTPSSGDTRLYDTRDGLLTMEFSPRAVYKNTYNDIFFGTVKGVLLFDPDDLVYNTKKPEVILSGFKLFNQEVVDYDNSEILDRHISVADRIELDYSQNMISFQFTAINMIHPEKNEFAYKMEPFDKQWHYVGTRREATYTNLDPGKYTFRVIASNNDDVWNTQGTSIDIIISPPWWLTWWFRLLVILAIGGILFSIYLFRTQQLRRQKQVLASRVRQSTSALRESNEQLKHKTEHLNETNTLLEERQQQILEQSEKLQELNTTKDRLFSIIAHDLTSPFNSILGFAEMLHSGFENMADSEKKLMINNIHDSSRRVYGLLDNLLNWAKAQTNRIVIEPQMIELAALVKESSDIFLFRIRNKEITFEIHANESVEIFADPNITKTIIRNLLSNAIKYTPRQGKILVNIEKNADKAFLMVTDTGVGMSESDCLRLFDLTNSASREGTDGEKGSGIGLILTRELIKLSRGELSVQSAIGKGSTFKISLPIEPAGV